MELFKMKDLFNRLLKNLRIQTQNEYVKFIKTLSRLKMKKKVFMKLANVEKDEN